MRWAEVPLVERRGRFRSGWNPAPLVAEQGGTFWFILRIVGATGEHERCRRNQQTGIRAVLAHDRARAIGTPMAPPGSILAAIQLAGNGHTITDGDVERLTRTLGWLSLGLGLTQIAAPDKVARFVGVDDTGDSVAMMRAVGPREIATGAHSAWRDRSHVHHHAHAAAGPGAIRVRDLQEHAGRLRKGHSEGVGEDFPRLPGGGSFCRETILRDPFVVAQETR